MDRIRRGRAAFLQCRLLLRLGYGYVFSMLLFSVVVRLAVLALRYFRPDTVYRCVKRGAGICPGLFGKAALVDRFRQHCCFLGLYVSKDLLAEYVSVRVLLEANRKFIKGLGAHSVAERRHLDKILKNSSLCDPKSIVEYVRENRSMICLPHSGDYWVSVIQVAKCMQGSDVKIVVPVHDGDGHRAHGSIEKLRLLGNEAIYLHIHDKASLTKLARYAKDPSARIVFFFDLSAQISEVRNGAVSACTLFGRRAYITDGAFRLASHYGLPIALAEGGVSKEGGYILRFVNLLSGNDVCANKASSIAMLEALVKKKPSDWCFFPFLDTYFHPPRIYIDASRSKQLRELEVLIEKLMCEFKP